jgi:hypothetical protein
VAKPCIDCKIQVKAPGGGHRCAECAASREPIEVRMTLADWRLAAVPEALRRSRVPAMDWPAGRRWCAGCQTFVRLADCGPGASRCATCTARSAQDSYLTRTYTWHGRPFTAADYDLLWRRQGGRCYICRRRSVSKRLAVDHDHNSTNVRGLLCPGEFGCNFAILGNIKDLAMARRIVEYLENPPADRWLEE